MKKTKRLVLRVLAILLLALTFNSCKKENNEKSIPNDSEQETLNKIKQLNEKQLQDGKVRMTFTPKSIESGLRLRRSKGGDIIEDIGLNAPCSIEVIDLKVTSIAIDYAGSSCSGSGYTYAAKVYFSIRKKTSTATFSPTSGISFDMTLSGPSSYGAYSALSPTYIGASGSDYNYETTITFSDPGTSLSFALSDHMAISATFQATCSGNLYWVEAYENYDLDATGECTTLSPIFVNPNVYGSKTFSASGWLLPCSTPPAHFVSPDEFEFQYRKSGNTTWITPSWSPSGYTSGPERVDVAETGIYQYRWRNKGTSPAACTGPYWDAFYTTSYPSVNVSY